MFLSMCRQAHSVYEFPLCLSMDLRKQALQHAVKFRECPPSRILFDLAVVVEALCWDIDSGRQALDLSFDPCISRDVVRGR